MVLQFPSVNCFSYLGISSFCNIVPELLIANVVFSLDDVVEAYSLIKDLEPTTPSEYILKGTVTASLGQEQNSVSTQLIFD